MAWTATLTGKRFDPASGQAEANVTFSDGVHPNVDVKIHASSSDSLLDQVRTRIKQLTASSAFFDSISTGVVAADDTAADIAEKAYETEQAKLAELVRLQELKIVEQAAVDAQVIVAKQAYSDWQTALGSK